MGGGTIASVPLDGGGLAQPLGTGQKPSGYLATDGTYVYWSNSQCTVDGGPCPSIVKVPVGGGPSTTLLFDQSAPQGVAVDGTSVYWANTGNNTIMKLTPK